MDIRRMGIDGGGTANDEAWSECLRIKMKRGEKKKDSRLAVENMKRRTWPDQSKGSRFTALPLSKPYDRHRRSKFAFIPAAKLSRKSAVPTDSRDFSALPYDILTKIAASFTLPNLHAASSVCRAWNDALRPLREAMVLLRWGKRFKHGRGGVKQNTQKALDSFLKGAARGSTLAMVDAGLVYWEMSRKEEAMALYRRAAELGDAAGQSNLGISYLQAEPPKTEEAIKWLYRASVSGHVRAQYQLALCLHQGRGVNRNLQEAARWYLKAAEGGYVRAMYNISLCYSFGEGLPYNRRRARQWMKCAADHGHSKAQFEHGLSLFSEGQMVKAVLYLELANRAGETAANHVKDVILQRLSAASHERVMLLADNWRALPSTR